MLRRRQWLIPLSTSFAMLLAQPVASATALPLPEAKPTGHKRLTQQMMLDTLPARDLFKKARTAAPLQPVAIGGYARGCLAGAVQLETDGEHWQAMRLSRNRHWGHPETIDLIKRLARDASEKDGWPGLLVGDIAMARGGPMWPSHASHQIGLDADIWFTPMPDRRLAPKERETLSATFMLTKDHLSVNPEVWTPAHERLLKRAASYPEVERVLIHPAIKRQLCKTAGSDRAWLSKMRPVWGHNYHFHIRLACPDGSSDCSRQQPVPTDDGCGAELTRWYKLLHARLNPPKVTEKKPRKPRPTRRLLTLNDLPAACTQVLAAQ